MATALVMPKLGLTMTEGLIANWLKNEGDAVKKGDALVEIETEKLTNVVESPADGTILKIIGAVGESLPIATVLAYIGVEGEEIPEVGSPIISDVAIPEAEPSDTVSLPKNEVEISSSKEGRIFASPAARALAKELNIDYTKLNGSGPGGRIVKIDVEAASNDAGSVSQFKKINREFPETIPYTGMRKAIGDSMSKSWMTVPMVTHHVKADVTELLILRTQLNKSLDAGVFKIGILDLFVKIVARAISDYPIVNATLSNNEIKILKNVNIGIAVAVGKGLVVPVVKDVTKKTLFAVSNEVRELIDKARNNKLSAGDMSGGTFTISNLGGYGSVDYFTPIINPPESAILGICRTLEEPVVRNKEIVIRSLAGLSFTFDHRVIDGAPAAEFLAIVLKYLENPARAIFED